MPSLKAFLAALPRGVLILPAHYHPVVFTTSATAFAGHPSAKRPV